MDRRDQALALAALGLLAGCRSAPEKLRVTFLDVGQGDAAVIEAPSGKVVLIDGGGIPGRDLKAGGGDPGSRVVVPFLRSRGISRIDLLIATHPDDDHVQGLLAVTERLRVQAVLDSGLAAPPGSAMAQLRALWKAQGALVHTARRGQYFALGEGTGLEVLHPAPERLTGTRSDENNNAIVVRLVYKKTRVLFAADAEQEAEASLRESGLALAADVLKVGHHGGQTSSGESFLHQVAPSKAIISCGRQNRFGHPHPEVLKRLLAQKIAIFRTDQQGALTLESDGAIFSLAPALRL